MATDEKDRLRKIETRLTSMVFKVDAMYEALMDNGQVGIITKINRFEGSIATWKVIAGSGGLIGVVALLLTLFG